MRALANREKGLLGALALAAAAWYYFKSGDGLGPNTPKAARIEGASWGEPPVVRMDLLASNEVDYDPGGRNLFQYYVPPPPVRPEPPVIERPIPPPPPPPAPLPPPPQEPRAPVRPQGPAPTFKFVGLFGPKDAKIAAFDDGQHILLARVGDVVQQHFKVVDFKYETVVLGFTDERYAGQTTELKFQAAKTK